MSPRAARNRAFKRMTPAFIKKHLPEHGRAIGNATSYGRELIAPALFTTAVRGMKGFIPGIVRVAKEVSDGWDGFAAGEAHDHKTAVPTIHNLKDFRKKLWSTVLFKGHDILETLKAADGKVIDEETDKIAQAADQAGAVIRGDLNPSYFLFNLMRNKSLKDIRRFYKEHLGDKTPGAQPSGQAKTIIMGTHAAAESFGLLDKFPPARTVLTGLGAMAIGVSYIDTVSVMEKTLLSETYATEKLGKFDGFALGIARYATRNMPNVEISPSYLEPLPIEGVVLHLVPSLQADAA